MPSFVTVTSGATAQAQDVNQVIAALNGTAGSGIPISLTALNDSVNFALAIKNADPTNSRSLQVLRSNNNVLIQADASGVIVSPDGGATTGQVLTVNATQTLTNKTFTSPVVSGAGGVTAGMLGFSGASLLVGDGTVNETVGPLGAWAAFTPTLTQGVALTLSTAVGRYVTFGKLVIASVDIVINSAGTAANALILAGLPATIRLPTANALIGHGRYWDNSGTDLNYPIEAVNSGNAGAAFLASGSTSGAFGISPGVTAAAADRLTLLLMYEVA